ILVIIEHDGDGVDGGRRGPWEMGRLGLDGRAGHGLGPRDLLLCWGSVVWSGIRGPEGFGCSLPRHGAGRYTTAKRAGVNRFRPRVAHVGVRVSPGALSSPRSLNR